MQLYTYIAKFKPCLRIVTVSTVSIGAKPAKVITFEFCWVYKDILELHALFFTLSALDYVTCVFKASVFNCQFVFLNLVAILLILQQ